MTDPMSFLGAEEQIGIPIQSKHDEPTFELFFLFVVVNFASLSFTIGRGGAKATVIFRYFDSLYSTFLVSCRFLR